MFIFTLGSPALEPYFVPKHHAAHLLVSRISSYNPCGSSVGEPQGAFGVY